jgi:hypothetical protein
MTDQLTDEPIACALGAGDLVARLAWIAGLNRRALREVRRDGLRLELTYDVAARDEVLEMVRRERTCCAFLAFEVREDPHAVRLVIQAPEGARDAAEMLFAPFAAKAQAGPDCGCRG